MLPGPYPPPPPSTSGMMVMPGGISGPFAPPILGGPGGPGGSAGGLIPGAGINMGGGGGGGGGGGSVPPGATSPMMGGPGGGGGGAPRIDPDQIPRPLPSRTLSSEGPLVFETRSNGTANPPPPSTSSFLVRDMGNCSPRFMRCSLGQVPQSAEVQAACHMPLLLSVQPLALQEPGEEPVQLVDLGEAGPPRCGRCKGEEEEERGEGWEVRSVRRCE